MSAARSAITRAARRRLHRSETVVVPIERLVFGAPSPLTFHDLAIRTGDVALASRAAHNWPDLADTAAAAGIDADAWRAEAIIVTRVWRSQCLAVVSGHDLVAAATKSDRSTVEVTILPDVVKTPLQSLLLDMGWLDGQVALYQPIDSPEVSEWPVVRACTDRLELMLGALADEGIHDGTYLDVASSYGWFVAKMQEQGFDASGIERDTQARDLGGAVYGLDPSRIFIGDCVAFLDGTPQFDVVSCLSLLHHFVTGAGACTAEEMLGMLAAASRRVLFIDTGEAHERWLRKRLSEWTPDFIHAWLTKYGDFDRVIALGVDHDDAGVFAGNYGRTLFACIRD